MAIASHSSGPYHTAMSSGIKDESWRSFFSVVLGTWLLVWLYAALHDQYLIRIAPEHFTVWHYKMPFFTSFTMLGIAYAFGASITPGLLLGVCLYFAGRLLRREKLPPRTIVAGTLWVCLAVELCSLAAGASVWLTRKAIYPGWLYPDESLPILITQSIQITAYLTGAIYSLCLIIWTWRRRFR